MLTRPKPRTGRVLKWFSAALLLLLMALVAWKHFKPPLCTEHKVYIAFGFHVNLYHSFRGDANDDGGVAKDIRIIRHIIDTLDHFNAMGVPVKGVWDFDNLFSLQELLPRYAPDIITGIRRRIQENGDEVILMSYNNGLVSAMTPGELDDAVHWSITNPRHSGVKDLFGSYTPIVRPQEMMTTPGTFATYQKYGIQAISLYYSETPFDSFRVFSRPLSRTEAHNPVLYRNPDTGEEIPVIPTYHIGDLVEHVSLGHWSAELHKLHASGELNADALIFINFDADSELWSGLDLPSFLSWLPNTSGIEGLISDVLDQPYACFTTLGEYLEGHSPVGSFYIGQDTADGSASGYSSWAEKASTNRNWTLIEQHRRVCSAARKALTFLKETMDTADLENLLSVSYLKRLRALSTTHFGMSTPYLSRQREREADTIMASLGDDSIAIRELMTTALRKHLEHSPSPPETKNGTLLDTILVLNSDRTEKAGGNRFLKIPIPCGYHSRMAIRLIRSDGEELTVQNLGPATDTDNAATLLLTVDEPRSLTDGIYRVYSAAESAATPTGPDTTVKTDLSGMSNGELSVRFENGEIEGIYLGGARMANSGTLTPCFKWKDSLFRALPELSPPVMAADGRSAACSLIGPFPGPAGDTLSDGWMNYRITLLSDLPYLILQGSLCYPSTDRRDTFKPGSPERNHLTDFNWQEVSPAQILFSPRSSQDDPVRILKRNYLGISSEYTLDYFRYSDRNLDLDNINNHITESYVGLVSGGTGMGISKDNSERSNFAFSPLKMRYDPRNAAFTIRANPFGTYYGSQYRPPTWGNGNGFDVTLMTGEQFTSPAPAYNGTSDHFSLLFAFFSSGQLPEEIEKDLIDFANPPVVISATSIPSSPSPPSSPLPPNGFVASYHDGGVEFGWDADGAAKGSYRILCGMKPGTYEATYPAVGNSLRVTRYADDLPFVEGRQYYAVIESVDSLGEVSNRSQEIGFIIRPPPARPLNIPIKLEIRVIWASLNAWLASFFT